MSEDRALTIQGIYKMATITKEQVIEWLSNQPVLEIADLVKELEEKWGVSAAAPAAVAAAPAGGAAAPAAEEQTEFDVRSEEHTSELQSRGHLVCRLLLEKKN